MTPQSAHSARGPTSLRPAPTPDGRARARARRGRGRGARLGSRFKYIRESKREGSTTITRAVQRHAIGRENARCEKPHPAPCLNAQTLITCPKARSRLPAPPRTLSMELGLAGAGARASTPSSHRPLLAGGVDGKVFICTGDAAAGGASGSAAAGASASGASLEGTAS